MTPDNHFQISRHWRLNSFRYELQGAKCLCGYKSFQQRSVCPQCGWETQPHMIGVGTVKCIESKNEQRELDLSVSTARGIIDIKLSLNGLFHTVEFEAGMKIPVLVQRCMKGNKEVIYSIPPISQEVPKP